jgi:hypothetical protein
MMHRKLTQIVPCLLAMLFSAISCLAQQPPAWEIFGGYSYQRSNVREYFKQTPILYALRDRNTHLDGFAFAATENLNRWFGGTLEVSGHYGDVEAGTVTTRQAVHSLLYGPRFFYRTRWITPFTHVLVGIAHASAKVTPVGPHASAFSFGVAAGGGVDVNVGKMLSVRPLQVDYFRANTLAASDNGYRASAGVVFRLGEQK